MAHAGSSPRIMDNHFDQAESLRMAVCIVALTVVIAGGLLFIVSYLLTGQYALIPYVLIPFELPFLYFFWRIRTRRNYRDIQIFVAYFFAALGLMKLTSEPFYLVDIFLLPVYIGMAFLVLKLREALWAVLTLILLLLASSIVVAVYEPFPLLYTNENISSLAVALIGASSLSVFIFYQFARHFQMSSALLGDSLLTLRRIKDDNQLLINVFSHDFRNYLVRVLMQIESGRKVCTEASQVKALENVENAIYNLSDLLNEVQDVRRLSDEGESDAACAELPLKQAVRKLEMLFKNQLIQKAIKFDTTGCENLTLKTNPAIFIHMILANLLGNAIKFSPKYSNIAMSTQLNGNRVTLILENRAELRQRDNLRKLAAGQPAVPSQMGTDDETGQGMGIVKHFCRTQGITHSVGVTETGDGLLQVVTRLEVPWIPAS